MEGFHKPFHPGYTGASVYKPYEEKYCMHNKTINNYVEGELTKYKVEIESRYKESTMKTFKFQRTNDVGSFGSEEEKTGSGKAKSFDSREA